MRELRLAPVVAAVVALATIGLGHATGALPAFVFHGAAAAILALGVLLFVLRTARPIPREPALLAALGVALLAPTPLLRVLALVAAVVLLLERRLVFAVPAGASALFALLVLGLALAIPVAERPAPGAVWALRLAALVVVGLGWARLAARPFEVALEAPDARWPVWLAACLALLLSAAALGAPFGWKGDEDHHVARLQIALEFWRFEPVFAALLATALAAPILGRHGRLGALGALVLGAWVGLVAGAVTLDESSKSMLDRYPLPVTWLEGALSLAPSTLPWPSPRFAEGWYRIVPVATTAATAALVARALPARPLARLLAALALVTVPVVHYYASLVYLEAPILLAMLVVLDDYARTPSEDGLPTTAAGHLALVALPFLKETALPFVAIVAAYAVLTALLRRRNAGVAARVALFFAIPLALAVLFKPPSMRRYVPVPAHLLDSHTYEVLGRALVEQHGAVLVLALVGLVLALRRGRRDLVLLALALFTGYGAFYALDAETAYLGLARFDLMLLPSVLVLARELVLLRPAVASAAFGLVLAANLIVLPVSPLTGARRPFFGDHVVSSSELVYPYRQAFELLAPGSPDDTLEVVGMGYLYAPESIYRRRFGGVWKTHTRLFPDEALQDAFRGAPLERWRALLREHLDDAVKVGPTAILVQLLPGDRSAWPERSGRYALAGDLSLGECRLLVYRR